MNELLDQIRKIKCELQELPHNKFWQVAPTGGNVLKEAIVRLQPKNILEIGTSSGYSSLWMAEGILLAGLTDTMIYTIDSHKVRHEFAKENFKKANAEKYITPILGHAPEAISQVPSEITFDLIFFDATKNQTVSFLEAVWPRLNTGGEIFVDNINSHLEQMQPFLNYLTEHNYCFEVLQEGTGMCRIQKPE